MSTKTSREIALERRKAMSDGGKKAALHSSSTKDRVRSSHDINKTGSTSSNKKVLTTQIKPHIPANKVARKSTSSKLSSKEIGIERRKAMSSHGKSAIKTSDRTRTEVKSGIQMNQVNSSEKVQVSEVKNTSIQDNPVVKPNLKRI